MANKASRQHAANATQPPDRFRAPRVPYRPTNPRHYRPGIGLIACGAITKHHLAPYRKAGYRVLALCDIDRSRAEALRDEYYPRADVYTDYRDVLRRDDIEVVDLAAHPAERGEMIEASLEAEKHVLSQKPFVVDLDFGQRMIDLARRKDRKLAVNQNGRWAPHFCYIRTAVEMGLIGEPVAAHLTVHWDHSWVKGTPFEQVKHLILYDFAIHWFDILTCFMTPQNARRVYASTTRSALQPVDTPLFAQALIEYDDAQASLVFDAYTQFGPEDRTFVTGTKGTLSSIGPNIRKQKVVYTTAGGSGSPRLHGRWFFDGFHGTMAELLCSIEENREPTNSAQSTMPSLALCFAAIASAGEHETIVPGEVRRLPNS